MRVRDGLGDARGGAIQENAAERGAHASPEVQRALRGERRARVMGVGGAEHHVIGADVRETMGFLEALDHQISQARRDRPDV